MSRVTDHTHTEKIGDDSIFILVVFQVERETVMTTLIENCPNNVAEYQALMMRLEMEIKLKITRLKVFGDSKLIINQLLVLYEVKKPELLLYIDHAKKLLEWFDNINIEDMPREKNR